MDRGLGEERPRHEADGRTEHAAHQEPRRVRDDVGALAPGAQGAEVGESERDEEQAGAAPQAATAFVEHAIRDQCAHGAENRRRGAERRVVRTVKQCRESVPEHAGEQRDEDAESAAERLAEAREDGEAEHDVRRDVDDVGVQSERGHEALDLAVADRRAVGTTALRPVEPEPADHLHEVHHEQEDPGEERRRHARGQQEFGRLVRRPVLVLRGVARELAPSPRGESRRDHDRQGGPALRDAERDVASVEDESDLVHLRVGEDRGDRDRARSGSGSDARGIVVMRMGPALVHPRILAFAMPWIERARPIISIELKIVSIELSGVARMWSAVLAFLAVLAPPVSPPLVIVNTRVISFDAATTNGAAIALKDGRIVAIGDESSCRAAAGDGATVIDAGGRATMRGFFDAHAHLMSGGVSELQLELKGARSEEEMIERLAKWRETLPSDEWIIGRGWDHTLFPNQTWPTRANFDSLAPNTPMLLWRVDGHSALANGAALRVAGIDESAHDPPDGMLMRDKDGLLTGILKEGAVNLVASHIPPRSFERKLQGTKRALEHCARFGITSCTDHGGDPDVYFELLKRGELTCRIDLWVDLADDLKPAIELRSRLEPVAEWIRFQTLKGFVDGTFGSRTSAMFEPFHDDAGTSGVLRTDVKVLTDRVIAADAAGFQVALHAIGDRAVAIALDAFEAAQAKNGTIDRRDRVEHAQVLRESDIPRFKKLGVTASMQPCHLLTDRRFAVDRIGQDRAKFSYAWKALADAGALLAFGTDYDVESLDPMRNLFAAVTREAEDSTAEKAYFPEQCLSLDAALAAMTVGGAMAAHREKELGPLVVGSLADLVVLDQALDAKQPREILKNKAWLTVVGGRVVFQRR